MEHFEGTHGPVWPMEQLMDIPPLQFVPENPDLTNVNVASQSPPRKRRRAIRKLQGDPETMQLGDLLFYNPPKTIFQLENTPKDENDDVNNNTDNPDESESVSRKSLRSRSNSVASQQSNSSGTKNQTPETASRLNFDENNEIVDDKDEQKEDENKQANEQPADDSDQVLTFDEKGNIVIKNPQALEVQSKIPEKPRANAVRSMTTYNSFRRNTRAKGNWTTDETAIFYTALEIVGTDFSLMEAAFFKDRGRTRKQLKQKFKREEKMNREYVDKILFKTLANKQNSEEIQVREVIE